MRLYIFIALLSTGIFSSAQKNVLDSLLNLELSTPPDSAKADLMGIIADQYVQQSNYDKALEYAAKIQELSKKAGYVKGVGKAYHIMFTVSYFRGDYAKCQEYGDIMLTHFKRIGDDIQYGGTLFQLANLASSRSRNEDALNYLKEAERIFNEKKYTKGQGLVYAVYGGVYKDIGEYEKALDYYFKALKIMEDAKNKVNVAKMLGNIALLYEHTDNLDQALKYHEKSEVLFSAMGMKSSTGISYLNKGVIYAKQNKNEKALEYYRKAEQVFREINSKHNLAVTYDNIGYQYIISNPDTALFYIDKAIVLIEELDDPRGKAKFLSHKCNLYQHHKMFEKAARVCEECRELSNKINAPDIEADANEILYLVYKETGQPEKSLKHYESFITIRDSTLNSEKRRELERKEMKYEFEKKESALKSEQEKKDFLYAEELKRKQLFYEFEKAQAELKAENEKNELTMMEEVKRRQLEVKNEQEKAKILEANTRKELMFKADLQQKESENRYQRNLIVIFVAALAVAVVLSILVFRGYNQKKKAHRIISLQKQEVEKQKLIVEEKNREIIDSIGYAKRLQEAIIPPAKSVKEIFENSFVLYKPKDIVAGDFYWMEKVSWQSETNNEELVFLAAADCTGHGVPGAMVSVVCSNALNRAVKEFGISDPGKILDKVRELVLETFSKSESEVKDGMDISLCCFRFPSFAKPAEGRDVFGFSLEENQQKTKNEKQKTLRWAGANNPLWIIRKNENGEPGLIEIKGDKQPVGVHPSPQPFTSHNFTPEKGDQLYIFTDGYADQFGGTKGKKFKYKNLQNVVLSLFDKPMEEQGKLLSEMHDKWKSDFEQTDDICMIGIRI